MRSTLPKNSCASCCQFRNQPEYLERAIPGLSSMSSAYASVRDEDGMCAKHDRYLSARSHCADYSEIKISR